MAALPSRRGILTGIAALAVAPAAAHAQVTPVSQIKIPVVTETMKAGPNSARFAAAQDTGTRPNVFLIGGNQECWPKLVRALQQAQSEGFPSRIVLGPTDAPPSLEVYAKGGLASRPINPNDPSITEARLTKLIKDVYALAYPTRLAAAPSVGRD